MRAAAVDNSGGAMLALYPRETEAQALAVADGQPADSIHLTLLYLGTGEQAAPMASLIQSVAGGIASAHEALAGEVGGVAQFEAGPDGAPTVALPDVPELTALREALVAELSRIGVESASEHGFQPHLTLGYELDPATLEDRLGMPLHFDAISVVVGSERTDYPLQAPPSQLLSAARPSAVVPIIMRDSAGTTAAIRPSESLPFGGEMAPETLKRRDAILAALTAAGVEDSVGMRTMYDLAMGSAGERCFYGAIITAGFSETRRAAWPSEAELADHGEVLYRGNDEGVFRLPDESIVHVSIADGWFRARIAAPTRSQGAEAVDSFAQSYPPLFTEQDDSGTVPITFWTNSQWGPVSRLRRIEASAWDTIERNYGQAVHGELARLVEDFEPGKDGQLLLWQGPPGTGKTWALRALASEWSDWAEFHYITDPDAFFVSNPSYMIDVLLTDSYEELTTEGDVLTSVNEGGKWKVLILEDTGELLSANAKEAYGQGLSRLLNVVDGMVGQGLRVLALMTTNDELGDLHPAAVRPGRCASQIVFAPLSAEEASEWLGEEVDEGGTLAELYARRGDAEQAFEEATTASMFAPTVTPTNAAQLRWQSVLMIEGEPTDDGRMIEAGAIDWRTLPLSLMAMTETGAGGHEGAALAGRIDEIWRVEQGNGTNLIMGRGVFDDGEYGQEVARLVSEGMLRGVSVDLAIRDFELRPKDGGESDGEPDLLEELFGENMIYVVTDGSIGAATVCPFPAFADAEIALIASSPLIWRMNIQSGMTIVRPAASSTEPEAQEASVASAVGLTPEVPPAIWFDDPDLPEPTPLTLTDDGRIFGHAAVWDVCHIGFANDCVLAPRTQADYAYFHLGEIVVDDGSLACGSITLGTGHASLRLKREQAVEHYDDSGTAIADVRVGEDEHGIWVAGALRPDASLERVRELRASKLSGDWRNVDGNLELVALLAVNVPGFPVPRLHIADADTAHPITAALVSAGVADRAALDALAERDDAELKIADLHAEAVGMDDLIRRARAA